MYQVAIVSDQPISRAGLEKLAADDARMRGRVGVATVEELHQQPTAFRHGGARPATAGPAACRTRGLHDWTVW